MLLNILWCTEDSPTGMTGPQISIASSLRNPVLDQVNITFLPILFFYFLAMPCGMWDLSLLSRNWTWAPLYWKCSILATEPSRKFHCYCSVAKSCPTLLQSHVWAVARQAPLSMGFSRQEYWSGLPFPSPGNLPNPGVKPISPASAGKFFTTESPGKSKVPLYLFFKTSKV